MSLWRSSCGTLNSVASVRPVELDRDLAHPVERLAARQLIENEPRALANDGLEIGEVLRREHGLHDLALLVMLGRVFHDEHGKVGERIGLAFERQPAEANTAIADVGREQLVVRVHKHDVLVFGDRPVAPIGTGIVQMDGVFLPQPLEIRQCLVGREELVMRGIEFLKRDRVRIAIDVDLPARGEIGVLSRVIPPDGYLFVAHGLPPGLPLFPSNVWRAGQESSEIRKGPFLRLASGHTRSSATYLPPLPPSPRRGRGPLRAHRAGEARRLLRPCGASARGPGARPR